MDELYYCVRAKECLDRASHETDHAKRLRWFALAAAWIDHCDGKPVSHWLETANPAHAPSLDAEVPA